MRQELIQNALPVTTDPVSSSAAVAEAVARALGHLLDELEPLVGMHGASALFGRSVHLVRRDHAAALTPATGTREAQLAGLRNELSGLDTVEARRISTALLTTFADLLTSLIGEPLTNRLLRSAWNLPPAGALPIEEKAK
ncbi:hypothetical protein ACFX58_14945 [Sphingomonas sp. NCPPB 2930]